MPNLTFPLKATFLALPLENQAKWQFQAIQEELQQFEDCLRFQNPQTPHLTLQYWKELMEIEFEPIREQAQKVAEKASPFTVQITGVKTFGNRGEDRVLYLDVAFSEELARLRKSCPWSSDKPFTPHVTLARVSHPQRFSNRKKEILKAADAALTVPFDRLRLYAEIDGHKQTVIEEFLFEPSF